MNTSKLFKNAIMNLYKQGIYTVDYAIMQAEALRTRNRITEDDYMDLLTYLAEEQAKELMPEISEEVNSEPIGEENSELSNDESEVE